VATALAVGVTLQIARVAGAAGFGGATLLRERARRREANRPTSRGERQPLAWRQPLLYDMGFRLIPSLRLLRSREQTAVHGALDACARTTDSVLEVGAGTGWYTGAIAARVRGVRAEEPAPAMRDRLERSVARHGYRNVTVHDGRLPLGDRPPADGIVCVGVLDYFHDLTDCLADLADHLAPGGWLVCTVPARTPEAPTRRRRLPHEAASFGRDVGELEDCARAAGLDPVAVQTVTWKGLPRTLVATLLRPQ
jgi:protein-L-isoaspartate O-methyltransferase